VAFEDVILPVIGQFRPDLVLVSAGFDAHERDPLAGMRLTTGAFGAMTGALRRAAEDCCGGRIALVTEGGYDLRALAASLTAAVSALAESGEPSWPANGIESDRGRRAVAAARAALQEHWKLQ
jgi:acetoin utilization deacetylase AcuC-like enzyme